MGNQEGIFDNRCNYGKLYAQKISTTVQESVSVSCNRDWRNRIQRNKAYIQGGDNQPIQEAVHPPHDGIQYGK